MSRAGLDKALQDLVDIVSIEAVHSRECSQQLWLRSHSLNQL